MADFRSINITKLEKELKSQLKYEYINNDKIRSNINSEDKINYFVTTSSDVKENEISNKNFIHKPCRSNMDFLYLYKDSRIKNIEYIENKQMNNFSRNNSLAVDTPVSYIYLSSYNLKKENTKSVKKTKILYSAKNKWHDLNKIIKFKYKCLNNNRVL